uniref:Uncharacterized protein n=1 Tax=Anguilla anguilla TaxID=7936 RepID=A0A0E9QC19_ANGAN
MSFFLQVSNRLKCSSLFKTGKYFLILP